MDAHEAENVLCTWLTKPQMIRVTGLEQLLRTYEKDPAEVQRFIESERPYVREKDGHEYVRRMPAVVQWPGLPWPSWCSSCEDTMPKQSFNVVIAKSRCLFPSKCARCTNQAKVETASHPVIDPKLEVRSLAKSDV